MHVVMILKDGFIDRSHTGDRIIPEHDGIYPIANQGGYVSGWFGTTGTGAILTPI